MKKNFNQQQQQLNIEFWTVKYEFVPEKVVIKLGHYYQPSYSKLIGVAFRVEVGCGVKNHWYNKVRERSFGLIKIQVAKRNHLCVDFGKHWKLSSSKFTGTLINQNL